jgi:glutaredoxin 2
MAAALLYYYGNWNAPPPNPSRMGGVMSQQDTENQIGSWDPVMYTDGTISRELESLASVGGGSNGASLDDDRVGDKTAPAYTTEANGDDFWREEAWRQQDQADSFRKTLSIALNDLAQAKQDIEEKEKLICDFQILHHRISSDNTTMRCLLKQLMAHSGIADAGDDMKDDSDLITEREVREFLK